MNEDKAITRYVQRKRNHLASVIVQDISQSLELFVCHAYALHTV